MGDILPNALRDIFNLPNHHLNTQPFLRSIFSLLAASGVHPKIAQSIMRHSDINLTMSRYTHIFRGQESQAVESLSNFSKRLGSKRKYN